MRRLDSTTAAVATDSSARLSTLGRAHVEQLTDDGLETPAPGAGSEDPNG